MRKHRQEISIERKLEIELELKQKEDIELNNKLSIPELVYYIEAIKMPYQEILDAIEWYDNNTKIDAVKFVNELRQNYNVEKDDIIKRIQDVRTIKKHLDAKNKSNVKFKKFSIKLNKKEQ